MDSMLLWIKAKVPHERYQYTVDRLLEARRSMDRSETISIYQDLIALAFNTTKYKAYPYQGDEDLECFISQDSIHRGDMVISLPCGHTALADPMKQWMKDHTTCPVCRHRC